MNKGKFLYHILLCIRMNLKKAAGDPRIYTVLAVSLVFQYYTFDGIHALCGFLGYGITPCVFPFFLGTPTMFVIYGGLAILLYCNAPFLDGQAPFVIARAGRRNWIAGQIGYVWVSAFLYTLWNCLCSILVLVPDISFEPGWGKVLETVFAEPEVLYRAGASVSFVLSEDVMRKLTPASALALAIFFYWLGTVLVGMIILCFHIWVGRLSGIVISGILTALSYFVCYIGLLSYGKWLRFLSPINWGCLTYMDWYGSGDDPSPGYAAAVCIILIAILSVLSVIEFCRKDVAFGEGVR